MIKVAIADDHRLFREGIRFIFDQPEIKGIELVAEAADGKELIACLARLEIDVVLLDLEMPGQDGIEILQMIKSKFPSINVIILTMHNDIKMMAYLMELGANSYLLKDTSPEELELAIKNVVAEGYYIHKSLSRAILGGLKGKQRKKFVSEDPHAISYREKEVLELICQGLTAKEIADKLFISTRTAEGHRKSLISKLGVKNTASLIVKAIKEEIITI